MRPRLHGLVISLALVLSAGVASEPIPVATPRFRAVAFDFLVLFNPDSVLPEVERAFPGRGREIANAWRTRQFEYTWLRSLTGRYVDFDAVTEDALLYATHAVGVDLTAEKNAQLMDAYRHLQPWPDAADALSRLRAAGIRVIALANFSPAMLQSNAAHAGLLDAFDALVSTDAARVYKPDPRAYQLGVDALHLPKSSILFAAFGGWDAVGGEAFGYPTVWVNRVDLPHEELGVNPDAVVHDLAGLVDVAVNGFASRAASTPGDRR